MTDDKQYEANTEWTSFRDLDATTKKIYLKDQACDLTDTVGFTQCDLPTEQNCCCL